MPRVAAKIPTRISSDQAGSRGLGFEVGDEVNIYDVATDTWGGTGSPMPEAAVTAGWGQAGPMLYVIGGWGDLSPANNLTVSQRYDMATDSWTTGPSFPSGRGDLALGVTQNHLFAIGGDGTVSRLVPHCLDCEKPPAIGPY